MRLNIVHKTGFRYASPVRASYNEARMTPSVNDTQTVWSSRLSIEPAAWSIRYTDYWGARTALPADRTVPSRGRDARRRSALGHRPPGADQ